MLATVLLVLYVVLAASVVISLGLGLLFRTTAERDHAPTDDDPDDGSADALGLFTHW